MERSALVAVDPEGDVTLLCGKPENPVTIRVSSHSLCRGSSVFMSMLAPHFREGTTLAASSSVEIELPDDGPEAMCIICHVLHLCNDEVIRKPRIELIVEIAMLADKYNCAEAMKPSAQCWMNQHMETRNIPGLHALLIAAYHFQHPQCFKDVSGRLAMRAARPIEISFYKAGNYIAKDMPTDSLMVGLSSFEALRKHANHLVAKDIERPMNSERTIQPYRQISRLCCCTERRFFSLTDQLSQSLLWPVTELENESLASTLEKMKKLKLQTPQLIVPCQNSPCAGIEPNCFKDINESIASQARSIESEIMMEICYDCAREGKGAWVGKISCGHLRETA